MSSRLGIQDMLCPCCGETVLCAALQCGCGARFVGEPLDETPIKVERLGPAMTCVALLALVVVAALVATKWLAFAAVLVMWSAWRALRLAKQNPGWYGGYKTSAATLSLTIVGSVALAAYGIAHVPQALENYELRQIAATQASIHHLASLLAEYQRAQISYPGSPQEFKKVIGDSPATDYWDRSIKYQPRAGDRASRGVMGPADSFELRSAGPDGIIGTDDDIVMRDGVLLTNSEVKNLSVVQQSR